MEGKGTYKIRSGFMKEDKIKESSNVQVEVCVEVDEQVERPVRCAHFMREDGDQQQIGREVLRTVSSGRQPGWSKLVGLGPDLRRLRACLRELEITMGGQKIERSRRKSRKFQNVEAANGVIEVVGVSSDSDVVSCLPSPDCLARPLCSPD